MILIEIFDKIEVLVDTFYGGIKLPTTHMAGFPEEFLHKFMRLNKSGARIKFFESNFSLHRKKNDFLKILDTIGQLPQ